MKKRKPDILDVEIFGFDPKVLSSKAAKIKKAIIEVAREMDIAEETFVIFIESSVTIADKKSINVPIIRICARNKGLMKKFGKKLKREAGDIEFRFQILPLSKISK